MICKVCNKVPDPHNTEDCFEKALNTLQQHYNFYKNALCQQDLELKQVNERNQKLLKALQLLQKSQQQLPPSKRLRSSQQNSDDSWLGSNSDRAASDISLTDEDPVAAPNLNMALNSEQLFDTSALSPGNNDINITSSSEFVTSPRVKESPKRNKQHDEMLRLKDCNNKRLERTKSEWHRKERNSPTEKSWATKFLKPSNAKTTEKPVDVKKTDKRLCLSLKKTNPSKIKQSLIPFNTTKDNSNREADNRGEDIIDASPMVSTKNIKHARSWTHRSGNNFNSNITTSNSIDNNNSLKTVANLKTTKDDNDKTIDDIVFDFSPTKKTDSTLNLSISKETKSKQLKFKNDDISMDCVALPNEDLGITDDKTETSSVVILTPGTQDIIFVDDSCNEDGDIDTMDLMADIMKKDDTELLENLEKYESKSIKKQQNNKLETFQKPIAKPERLHNIKQEKVTQNLMEEIEKVNKIMPTTSCINSINTKKPQNPLFSSENQDDETDDEDAMPKPLVIKQEPPDINKKLCIKERFNIECAECEKLINFLDDRLTDKQIQQHLDKCKHHNAENLRQNTPEGFWNPFILSLQADEPRNEVLVDTRLKDRKK